MFRLPLYIMLIFVNNEYVYYISESSVIPGVFFEKFFTFKLFLLVWHNSGQLEQQPANREN